MCEKTTVATTTTTTTTTTAIPPRTTTTPTRPTIARTRTSSRAGTTRPRSAARPEALAVRTRTVTGPGPETTTVPEQELDSTRPAAATTLARPEPGWTTIRAARAPLAARRAIAATTPSARPTRRRRTTLVARRTTAATTRSVLRPERPVSAPVASLLRTAAGVVAAATTSTLDSPREETALAVTTRTTPEPTSRLPVAAALVRSLPSFQLAAALAPPDLELRIDHLPISHAQTAMARTTFPARATRADSAATRAGELSPVANPEPPC